MSLLGLLAAPSPFVISNNVSSIDERWKSWRSNFFYYIDATGVESNQKMKAIFLYIAGVEVQEVFETMEFDEPATYEEVIDALDSRFSTMNLDVETKVKKAALRAKRIGLPISECSQKIFTDNFCRQLSILGLKYDREKELTLDKPDVFVHSFGPVIIISKLQIEKHDIEKAQNFANNSGGKCTLIKFGEGKEKPNILTFYSYPDSD